MRSSTRSRVAACFVTWPIVTQRGVVKTRTARSAGDRGQWARSLTPRSGAGARRPVTGVEEVEACGIDGEAQRSADARRRPRIDAGVEQRAAVRRRDPWRRPRPRLERLGGDRASRRRGRRRARPSRAPRARRPRRRSSEARAARTRRPRTSPGGCRRSTRPRRASGRRSTGRAGRGTARTRPRRPSTVASTRFIAGEPMKPATKRSRGCSYSACGVSTWRIRPSRITATRWPSVIASTWSWVTYTVVTPSC